MDMLLSPEQVLRLTPPSGKLHLRRACPPCSATLPVTLLTFADNFTAIYWKQAGNSALQRALQRFKDSGDAREALQALPRGSHVEGALLRAFSTWTLSFADECDCCYFH